MYIDTVYLGTYSQKEAIKGRFTIKDESFIQTVEFTLEEAAAIQELCAKALDRFRAEAAAKLLEADIRVPMLEAPKADPIEDADFEEVNF